MPGRRQTSHLVHARFVGMDTGCVVGVWLAPWIKVRARRRSGEVGGFKKARRGGYRSERFVHGRLRLPLVLFSRPRGATHTHSLETHSKDVCTGEHDECPEVDSTPVDFHAFGRDSFLYRTIRMGHTELAR